MSESKTPAKQIVELIIAGGNFIELFNSASIYLELGLRVAYKLGLLEEQASKHQKFIEQSFREIRNGLTVITRRLEEIGDSHLLVAKEHLSIALSALSQLSAAPPAERQRLSEKFTRFLEGAGRVRLREAPGQYCPAKGREFLLQRLLPGVAR